MSCYRAKDTTDILISHRFTNSFKPRRTARCTRTDSRPWRLARSRNPKTLRICLSPYANTASPYTSPQRSTLFASLARSAWTEILFVRQGELSE